jgi:acetyltransferase-like isoleucine patch superfamily enzyme
MLKQLRYYLANQAASLPAYVIEQLVLGLFGWIPSIVGVGIRAIAYRAIMTLNGMPAIEAGVRIVYASNVKLGRNSYLDQGVYLNALPSGITIGEDTFIMHHTVLHTFNYRNLPRAGITIGKKCFIGELNVMRGQGGIHIGDGVYTGPMVQIMAINHVYDDLDVPIREQGITAKGITIEDDVWIGSGAVILDGVTIGQGSVIGAGAVVIQDIPPYSLAVGSPAKPIGDRRQANGKPQNKEVFFGDLEWLRRQMPDHE